jgi:large subunit ribosomal protein L29
MSINDLKDKTKEELSQQLTDLRAKILKLNFDLADNKVKDVSQVKKTKKEIARILTIQSSQNINSK